MLIPPNTTVGTISNITSIENVVIFISKIEFVKQMRKIIAFIPNFDTIISRPPNFKELS